MTTTAMTDEQLETIGRIAEQQPGYLTDCVKEIARLGQRVESLEMALDNLLEMVDGLVAPNRLWQDALQEVVDEARAVQAGGGKGDG